MDNNKIPLIHTMQDDLIESQNSQKSPILSAQEELQNKFIPSITTNAPNRAFLFFRLFLIILILFSILAVLIYLLYFSKNNPKKQNLKTEQQLFINNKNHSIEDYTPQNTTNQNNKSSNEIENYLANEELKNIWPEISESLAPYINEATTSKNLYVIISITNFEEALNIINNNKNKILPLAKRVFDIDELSEFSNQTLNNQELFVADATIKPIIYGFVGEKYFLITASIKNWFTLKDKLLENVISNN